jgi:hypothetical protein
LNPTNATRANNATTIAPRMMMSGIQSCTLFWIAMDVLLCLLMVTCIWLLTRWLKHVRAFSGHYTVQPRDAYQDDQQGYQAQQPFLETYEEDGRFYPYPQEEQYTG